MTRRMAIILIIGMALLAVVIALYWYSGQPQKLPASHPFGDDAM